MTIEHPFLQYLNLNGESGGSHLDWSLHFVVNHQVATAKSFHFSAPQYPYFWEEGLELSVPSKLFLPPPHQLWKGNDPQLAKGDEEDSPGRRFHGKENGSGPRCRAGKGASSPRAIKWRKRTACSGEQGHLQDRTSSRAREHPPGSVGLGGMSALEQRRELP